MRICIDIDGTICPTKVACEAYKDMIPKAGAINTIQNLKAKGNWIILYSSRNMKTCDNNLGRIIASQGKVLIPWLEKWEIPYDELWFGKPLADVYIDDKALKFDKWSTIPEQLENYEALV